MKLNLVPARTGWLWVTEGLKTFRRQPLALSGLFFLFMMAVSLVSLVPLVGNALALTLLPAATLGLMAASKEASQGHFPMPSILISAFRAGREQARAMAILGGINAVGILAVLGASALCDDGAFARLYLFGGTITPELVENTGFQQAVWLAIALYLPWSLLFWHAPALVHWGTASPVKSLFFSWVACLNNWRAMTVYMLGWVAVFLGIGVVLMLVSMTFNDPSLMGSMMFAATLILAAMFFSSMYFSFRDSFILDAQDVQAWR